MDTCVSLTEETTNLVNKRRETIDEKYNERLEKERVRITLDKAQHGSVFGLTQTETTVSEVSEESHSPSLLSNSSSKRLQAEAELGATQERVKVTKDVQFQQLQLTKLEKEFKLEEAKMLADLEWKRLERQSKLEEERIKLEQLKAEREVRVAAAQVRVYDSSEGEDGEAKAMRPETECTV